MTLTRLVKGPQAAVAVIPLTLLTASWTVGIAGPGTSLASSDRSADPAAPRATGEPAEPITEIPTEALEAPATVSETKPEATDEEGAKKIAENESVRGIPTPALSAYRRAETVMNAADESCRIDWQLLAAVGRVESNHGRYGGNVLDDDGRARPGIYGIALDGTNGTRMIADTDAGKYDNDKAWDRAVGPMQFIPSTWSVVAVDSDGDGERNPQDIDDAVLGAAVYLCAGDEDLSTEGGRKDAIFRYNNSDAYVQLVLAIHEAYLEGDYTPLPEMSYAGSAATPIGARVQSRSVGAPDPDHAPELTGTSGSANAGGPGRPSPTEPRPQQGSADDSGKNPQGNGGRGPKGNTVLVEQEPTLPAGPKPTEPSPPTPASETPSGTPSEAPSETPSETPTETPSETPSKTPPETPTETPSETPSKTPPETPTETPSEAPAEEPTEPAPADTPTSEAPADPPPSDPPADPPADPPPSDPPAPDPRDLDGDGVLDDLNENGIPDDEETPTEDDSAREPGDE